MALGKDNKTVYAILGLLNHSNMTGYEIKKRIDMSLSFFWNAGFGQIYPTLKGMVEGGLIIKGEETGDARNKIVYSITEKGRVELKQWLAKPAEKEYIKYEILLKLFFGSIINLEQNINLIKEFKARNSGGYELLKMYKEQLSGILDEDNDHVYYYLTVLFGEKIYKAYMEWSEEAIAILENNISIGGEEHE